MSLLVIPCLHQAFLSSLSRFGSQVFHLVEKTKLILILGVNIFKLLLECTVLLDNVGYHADSLHLYLFQLILVLAEKHA